VGQKATARVFLSSCTCACIWGPGFFTGNDGLFKKVICCFPGKFNKFWFTCGIRLKFFSFCPPTAISITTGHSGTPLGFLTKYGAQRAFFKRGKNNKKLSNGRGFAPQSAGKGKRKLER
jgi:hypothetical protein